MKKLLPVMLLGAALEVAWLMGGLDLLQGKSGSGMVGQIGREVSQVKQLLEKAREALEPPVASRPVPVGDASRNPFALPPGVQLLGQVAEASSSVPGTEGAQPAKPAPPPEPPARELSGILVSSRERIAIIDGALLRAGDTIEGGERVVDIRADRVVLAWDNGRRTLRLPPPFPTP